MQAENNQLGKRMKYYRTGRKSLTEKQALDLLSVITNIEHLGLFELALSTGIRRGDIVKIKTKDFDHEKKKITFYEAKKRRTRAIFIPERVANTLQMIVTRNRIEPYLFTGKSEKINNRGHMTGRTAYNYFQKYLKKINLDPRPFHALRATCIKLCQKRGWKPEETSELTGDTISVIQEHYLVPSTDDMKAVTKEKAIL